MMTTYVILSRVKSADGLLLLRAFCPNMFAMGALPGPSCLLKLLRYKFSGFTQGSDSIVSRNTLGHTITDDEGHYSEQAALDEYHRLMKLHEAWKVQRREFGPDWQCSDCGLKFPAAAYGVNWRESSDVHTKVVACGYWRCCSTCRKIRDM